MRHSKRRITPSFLFRIEVIFTIAFVLAFARQASATNCAAPAPRYDAPISNFFTDVALYQECLAKEGAQNFFYNPAVIDPVYPVFPLRGIGNVHSAAAECREKATSLYVNGLLSGEKYALLISACGGGGNPNVAFGYDDDYSSLFGGE